MKTCLEEAVRQGVSEASGEDGVQLADMSVESREVTGVGEQAVVIGIRAAMTVSDLHFPFAMKIEFGRQGRAAAYVLGSAIGASDVQDPVDERVRALLAGLQSA
jgi:hypothetical protein